MSMKISLLIEPIESTTKLSIGHKKGQSPISWTTYDTPTPVQTPALLLESGDQLQLIAETGRKIVLDSSQNVVRLEAPESPGPTVVEPPKEVKPPSEPLPPPRPAAKKGDSLL